MQQLHFTPKMTPKESQIKMCEKDQRQSWDRLLLSIRLDMSKNNLENELDCDYDGHETSVRPQVGAHRGSVLFC